MTVYAETKPLRLNQTGTMFRVTVKDEDGNAVNISAATTLELKFKSPTVGAAVITKTAGLTSGGADGRMQFKDTAGDLTNVVGSWKFWGRVVLAGGEDIESSSLAYDVYAGGEE